MTQDMTALQAIEARHAVRSFADRPIAADTVRALREEIDACNKKSGLSIRLVLNDADAFAGLLAKLGGFHGAVNYLALAGPAGDAALAEKAGYYGERLVLRAQQLGLNTCWVAGTYKKGRCKAAITEDEKLMCVVALGYGVTQGKPHKSKPMDTLCKTYAAAPAWFESGMRAALLAPTALNRQDFFITLGENGEDVSFRATGGEMSRLDLGIVKYHFEIGAQRSL